MKKNYIIFLFCLLYIALPLMAQDKKERLPYYDVKYILRKKAVNFSGDYCLMTTDGKVSMLDSITNYDRMIRTSKYDIQGYGIAILNEKLAFIDSVGRSISRFEYDLLDYYDPNGVFPAFKTVNGGRWGILNSKFEEIFPFEYWKYELFNNRGIIALQQVNDLWGVIESNTGKIILDFKYNWIESFTGNGTFILAGDKRNRYCLFTIEGKEVYSSPDYLRVNSFRDSLYIITKLENDKFAVIVDGAGKTYSYTGDCITSYNKNLSVAELRINYRYMCAVLDKQFEPLTEFIYDDMIACKRGGAIGRRNRQYVYLDSLGIERIVSPYKIEEETVIGHYIRAYDDSQESKAKKYNYAGEFLGDINNEKVTKDFLHRDYDERTGKYGYYRFLSLELVIPHKYKIASSFNNGYAIVAHRPDKGGVIDTLGNEVIPVKYNGVERIGKDCVLLKKGKDCYFSDMHGNRVSEIYDKIDDNGLSKNYAVHRNGYWGIATEEGKEIIPCIYDTVYQERFELQEYYIVGQSNKIGLLDMKTGKQVLSCQYDEIEQIQIQGKRYFLVRKGRYWGLLDLSETVCIPIEYDIIEPYYGDLLIVAKNVTCETR